MSTRRRPVISSHLAFVLLTCAFLAAVATAPRADTDSAHVPPPGALPILSWGDQGDGTYRNPILKADYSDPDVVRVGDDFYLVASDFHFVGIQVLHSRDLVNWRIVGQVFDRLDMHPRYDELKGYSQGTWAPTLRYHRGEFYLYVCAPHDGLFMYHAKDARGPWSAAVTVRAVDGWEDPAPFWDDDGRAYLVRSRLRAGPLILHRMSPDGRELLDEGVEIYHGPVAEGPKLFKRHGYYYISLPEGGVGEGGQTMLRARSIYGPYERKVVLLGGSPHQGGIVDLKSGESWFIGFKSSGHLGRLCHLLPVTWGADDWPTFGDNGQAVERWKKPAVGQVYPVTRPQTDDDFDQPALQPQWQWNHNPVAAAWSLSARPGWLRLQAQPADDLPLARNTLTQKLWDDAGMIDVHLDLGGMLDGGQAGLTFMSGNLFGRVGVEQVAGQRRIGWMGGAGPALVANEVWLRGTYAGDTAHLAYSLDGRSYSDTGTTFTLKFAQWKGARVGIFNYGGGSVDVDSFRYTYGANEPH